MNTQSWSKPPVALNHLIQGLAWFSVGLGLAELLAPRRVTRAAGMNKNDTLIRGYGLREIATGVGLLVAKNPKPWLWGRVAGDVLDMATLGATANTRRPASLGGSFAGLIVVGLLDLYAALAAKPAAPVRIYENSGRDYSRRSGLPRDPNQMRGAAADRRKLVSNQTMPAKLRNSC